jgi:pyridoxal phosphate enzyme (YggS family)
MAVSSNLLVSIERVRESIERACAKAGRDSGSVELVAVSKAHGADRIREAYEAGLRVFGENYAQELAKKADSLSDLSDLQWRFIGHLQRNKIKLVERARASIDTVDSLRLAQSLSLRGQANDVETEILIQVNVGGEAKKSGCAPAALPNLVEEIRGLAALRLRGLMTVAPHFDDPEDARPCFAKLRRLAEEVGLETLSMGMTHDLEPAIAEGATMVRIGTALFGQRQ